MSYTHLTAPALRRLATARASGRPYAPTRTDILISSASRKPCPSFTNLPVYAAGGATAASGARRFLTTSPASHLSTKRQPGSDTAPKNSSSYQPSGGAPALDEFSFKALGMTRGVKVVVYTAVGILGTIETIFWARVLWRWWTNAGEEDEPQ